MVYNEYNRRGRALRIAVRFTVVILFLSVVGILQTAALLPDMPQEPQMPGRLEADGMHFELNNSEYLNITLDSSEPIDLTLESLPEMVTMNIESASGATSAQIILGGFLAYTTYHKYEDDYHNHTAMTTDANGRYTYIQDLSKKHLVFIQPRPSTKFINDNETGGDCTSIGAWTAATKTCTLTTDLGETIQIDSDGVTLNGNGHTLTGRNTGSGVYLLSRTGVNIQNLEVKQFINGIYLGYSSSNTLSGNNASNNNYGIYLGISSNDMLSGNNASNNNYGIYLYSSSNNTLSGNNANSNNLTGIYLSSSSSNNIYNNYFNNNENFGFINTGINTWNTTRILATNIIAGPYIGGNFWGNPGGTGFSQTWTDSNGDGFTDAQYTLDNNNIDYLPLAKNTAGLPGDINGNGQLTLVDAIYLAKHVGGFIGYETIYADGDINANGQVTLVDAIYLAKHVGGFIGYEKIY